MHPLSHGYINEIFCLPVIIKKGSLINAELNPTGGDHT